VRIEINTQRRGLMIGATMKSILDPSFRYIPSHATDVRKTFERILRDRQTVPPQQARSVVPLNRERRSA
jgi:hypothetical protein